MPHFPGPLPEARPRLPVLPQSQPQEGRGRLPHAAQPGNGQRARIAAHLFMGEERPLLLLRVPHLAEQERRELEARLTGLIETLGLGLRRPRLVIREIVTG